MKKILLIAFVLTSFTAFSQKTNAVAVAKKFDINTYEIPSNIESISITNSDWDCGVRYEVEYFLKSKGVNVISSGNLADINVEIGSICIQANIQPRGEISATRLSIYNRDGELVAAARWTGSRKPPVMGEAIGVLLLDNILNRN